MRSLKEIIVVVLWSVLALSLMLVPLGITAVSADNFTSVISENLTFIESVNVSSDSVCFNGYYAWSYTPSTTSYFVYNIPSFKYSNDTVIHYSWPSRDSTNSDSLSCEAGEIEIPVSSAREVFYIYGSDYYCCVFDVDYILSLNPPIPCQYSVMSVDTLNLNHSYPVGYALPFDCLFFNSESSGSYLYFSCFNSHRFRNNYQSVEEQASYCWVTYPDNDSSRVLDISVSVAQNNDTGCYTVDLNKSDNTTPYDLHIDYDFIRDNLERTLLASGVSAHNSGIIDSEYNVSSLPADSYKHSYLGQGYSGYYYYNMSVTSNNTTHYLAWGEDKHYNSSLPAVNNTTTPTPTVTPTGTFTPFPTSTAYPGVINPFVSPGLSSALKNITNFSLPTSLKEVFNIPDKSSVKEELLSDENSSSVFWSFKKGILDLIDGFFATVENVVYPIMEVILFPMNLLNDFFVEILNYVAGFVITVKDYLAPFFVFAPKVISFIPAPIVNIALIFFSFDLFFIFIKYFLPSMINLGTSTGKLGGKIAEKANSENSKKKGGDD